MKNHRIFKYDATNSWILANNIERNGNSQAIRRVHIHRCAHTIAHKSCSRNVHSERALFFLCCLYECYSRDNKKIHSSFFPGTATAVFITKPGNGSGVLWIPNRINLTHNKIKADYYFYLCTMRRCGSECAKCNFAFVVRWYGQKFAHFCKDPKHVNVIIVMWAYALRKFFVITYFFGKQVRKKRWNSWAVKI